MNLYIEISRSVDCISSVIIINHGQYRVVSTIGTLAVPILHHLHLSTSNFPSVSLSAATHPHPSSEGRLVSVGTHHRMTKAPNLPYAF
ncbi:Protein of unknown function [Pyronema omphalodes CBS 100304]|uniref:Uncharacterized protein n=1 Tax=Pyronema omphalodes (strain CBS 100304) TaxID=1076935 RepID=U4L9A2_PYROM|nr:Protein of unknown function [Pyronema omphalodes CBS 100304]